MGKYTYQGIPMGIYISPDVFQEKMSMLFQEMVQVCAYMDNLAIIRKNTYKKHVDILYDIIK